MHEAVRSNWLRFNEPLEGRVTYMYLDVKGWVSTGLGNKIDQTKKEMSAPTDAERADSYVLANKYPWTDKDDGQTASPEQVAAEWDTVKSHLEIAHLGHTAMERFTHLRISDDQMDDFAMAEAERVVDVLLSRTPFVGFEAWPASAQIATLSMAWAMGPSFNFPKFQGYAAAGDWASAAIECHFNPDIGTIVFRNRLDRLYLECAAVAVDQALPAENLTWSVATILGVQHALWMTGIDLKFQDGEDGPKTQAAVSGFQEQRGLTVNGVWNDPDTQAALAAELSSAGWNVV